MESLFTQPLESMLESMLRSLLGQRSDVDSYIPGPGLPLLGDLPTAAKWMADNKDKLPMHRTLELHQQYGPVYSFNVGSATFVIVGEEKEFKRVLMNEDFQEHVSLPFLKKFGASRGLFMADADRWKLHRRFSHRCLRDLGFGKSSMIDSIEEEASHLIQLVAENSESALEAQPTVAKAVSNVINRLVFGKRFGYEDAQFDGYLRHTRMVTNVSLMLVFLPMMLPWLESFPELMRRLPGSNTFAQGYAFVKEFCMREIRQHEVKMGLAKTGQEGQEHEEQVDCNNNCIEQVDCNNNSELLADQEQDLDFITLFLQHQQRLQEEQSPDIEYFTNADLCDILADFFVAGTDTTAVALTWSLLLAAVHQEKQDKLRAELYPLRTCSCLWQQQQQLHYTRAFIDEAMRISVLTPINFRCARIDTKVAGRHVPAGTVVGANAFAISRDPSLFPEPEQFRPERFLSETGCYQRHPTLESIVFGGGKRGCMGESLARAELLTFFSRLMQNFQIEVPANERPRLQQILLGEDGAVHQPAPHRLLFSPLPTSQCS